MSDELFAKMAQAIIDGEAEDAAALAQEGLDAGIAPGDILDKGFVKGIEEVGDLFAKGEFFLPELVQGAEAMKASTGTSQPMSVTVKPAALIIEQTMVLPISWMSPATVPARATPRV